MTLDRIVHIVDDDLDFRLSLARRVEANGHATTSYASAEAFLAVAPRVSEGCVLLVVQIPHMGELVILETSRRLGMRAPVIVMAVHGDVSTVVRAMLAGASDFLVKPFGDQSLLAMIEKTFVQPVPYHPDLEVALAIERVATLTPREHQVLAGLLGGRSSKTIAFGLNISVRTVEVHRARLMQRLGVHTFAEAIRFGILASLR